jgi:hypothetical protein
MNARDHVQSRHGVGDQKFDAVRVRHHRTAVAEMVDEDSIRDGSQASQNGE